MSNQPCALKHEPYMCTEIHSSTNSPDQPGDEITTELDVLLEIVTQPPSFFSFHLPFHLPASKMTSWVCLHSVPSVMNCLMKQFLQAKNIMVFFLILMLIFLHSYLHGSHVWMEEIKENVALCRLGIKIKLLHHSFFSQSKTLERSCISSTSLRVITQWVHRCQWKQQKFWGGTDSTMLVSLVVYKANFLSKYTPSTWGCHCPWLCQFPNGSSRSSVVPEPQQWASPWHQHGVRTLISLLHQGHQQPAAVGRHWYQIIRLY